MTSTTAPSRRVALKQLSTVCSFLLLLLLLLLPTPGQSHDCERPCQHGDYRTCMYEFNVQEYHTLSRACYQCPSVASDCTLEDCIAADGVARPLIAVNRQLPGPAIQVCEGDRVVVDVHNWLLSDAETIHFHGQHMRDFQYYDGVPFITQCPIQKAFRYDFIAATPGTHWWHSHIGVHRAEGVFGALVVREPEDWRLDTHDVDNPAHVLILQDWLHESALDKFAGRHHYTDDDFANTILINGKGRNLAAKMMTPLQVVQEAAHHGVPLQMDGVEQVATPLKVEWVDAHPGVRFQTEGVEQVATPLEVVRVTPGIRHRLRLINAGSLNCPMIFSVDNHKLTIIATDGQNIVPVTANSLVIYSGERFDVVLHADQPIDNYWIRVNGLIDCEQNECVQGAVLRYGGAPQRNPTPSLTFDPNYPPGVVVNPLNSDGAALKEVTMVELESLDHCVLQEKVDRQFFLAFNFNQINNTLLYRADLYPYNAVSKEWQINTPQVNNLTFQFPASPPLSQPQVPQPTFCCYGQVPPCDGDYCSCTYVLEVALGETVEMVLVDEGIIGDENHPFHLHGYNFHVVAMERLGRNTTLADVMALDAAGGIARKLTNAVKKDSVTIPDGGYTVIRFTADNPGWWLMHCHLSFHSELGMAAVLHVGNPSDLPPVPKGFPTCGSFIPHM